MRRVEVSKATTHLSELVDAASHGEIVIITANEQQVRLVPLDTGHMPSDRHFGSAKGEISMAEDFDVPLEDFREYME